MADFSFISDSGSDEGAVEELLNQAMDDTVLKQIAALNLSSFSSDSVLPTQLETRFRSLKSFPSTNAPKASTLPTNKNSSSSSSVFRSKSNLPSHKPLSPKSKNNLIFDDEDDNSFEKKSFESKSASGSGSSRSKAGEKPDPNGKRVSNSKARSGSFNGRRGSNSRARSGYFLSPSDSSGSGSSPSKARSGEEAGGYVKKDLNPEARSGSFLSSSDCSNSWVDSPSPPKKTGCFWCSPKRVSEKKSKGDRELGFDDYWRRNNKEILADLSVFSAKKQQKMLKMAMKEEQKVNREAEKIVKWAKQASARMNVSDIEDELSDCENHK